MGAKQMSFFARLLGLGNPTETDDTEYAAEADLKVSSLPRNLQKNLENQLTYLVENVHRRSGHITIRGTKTEVGLAIKYLIQDAKIETPEGSFPITNEVGIERLDGLDKPQIIKAIREA